MSQSDPTRWRQIEEFPNYWVSDTGKIFSMKNKRLKKLINERGHIRVNLSKDAKHTRRSVEKLRKEAFGD